MQIIGAGLSRTGTTSLHTAFEILGFRSVHLDAVRLNDIILGYNRAPHFRRYDDVDTVTDLPSALFYRELMSVYPESLVILTVRNEDDWWASAREHFQAADELLRKNHLTFDLIARIRRLAYGSADLDEYLYRKHFREHNWQVEEWVPPDRLLKLDIAAGDGWEKLCPFLNVEIPGVAFPHENSKNIR